MRIGFEVTAQGNGGPVFHLFQPAKTETGEAALLTFAQSEPLGHAVVLMGQLYYRDELQSRLPSSERARLENDAALALAMFCTFGAAGLALLEGDIALVAFDGKNNRFIAMRDPFGAWPLFWSMCQGVLHIGTRLRGMSDQVRVARIDRDYLASFLMYPFAFAELPREATAFVSVQRILPGTIVALSPNGKKELISTWDWIEKAGDVDNVDIEGAGTRLGDILNGAVAQRTERGTVAAHLSGGLDSSSVVCLARRQLAAGPSARRLVTLSLIYDAQSLSGEKHFIRMIADQGGPIEPHFINGDAAVDFDWFSAPVPDHDEPYAGLFHLQLEKALVEAARQVGATRILTGAGADDVLGGNRFHLADMLHRGQVRGAIAEASQWARLENTSLWSTLREYGINPNLPDFLHDGVSTILRHGYGRFPDLGHFSVPPWIRRDFAQENYAWRKGLSSEYGIASLRKQLSFKIAILSLWIWRELL